MIVLHLDPLEKRPLYIQIVEQIEEAVRDRQVENGHALWSARKIASHYHISYQTAERALKELARRGIVRRSVARGTVVSVRGEGDRPKPKIEHRVIALISCWQVWSTRPTYTMAELEMLQAAAHTLSARLWGMLTVAPGSGDAPRSFSIENLADWCRVAKFDGAIIFGNMPERGLEWLSEQGYALVVADYDPAGRFPRVIHDNYGGMQAAINHLIELGHRRIAYLGAAHPYHYGVRQKAYADTLREHGIEVDPELIVSVRRKGPVVKDALDLWINLPMGRRPTAIAAGSDIMAAQILKNLQERGLKVPDAFSLTGYDDESFATVLDPPLTTLRVSWSDMGRTAADLLLQELENANQSEWKDEVRRVVAPAQLIVRESTAPI